MAAKHSNFVKQINDARSVDKDKSIRRMCFVNITLSDLFETAMCFDYEK